MKKRLIPIALVMGAISANAQVGIGTSTPNKSAELTVHAKKGDRGILIPNVSLSSTKDIETIKNGNVNSLLVFNINTVSDVTPGYYYWYIDTWQRLTTESDIPAIVVNNFENILNMEGDKVTNLIKNIVRNTEGNVIYEGDKLYYINADGDKVEINFGDIVAANESKTVIVSNTSKKQQYYISESYLQVNDTPTQATIDTWAAGTIPAGVYAIDVVGGVVNNFEEVVNQGPINVDGRTFPTINDYITYLTESTGGFTKIVYDVTTGDAIFQEWDEVTKSWVNVNNAKFKKIVTDNESKTVIVSNTSKKQQYYIAEAYLQANQLPTQATIDAWTAGTVPAGVYAIDVVGGVVNNFQEFVNHGPITVDGRTYPTINDYITYLTESTGGFTKIVYDSQNRNASFQQWDEATQQWVNVINSKFKKIITDNESQTVIITVNDKQYYVSEAYLAANDGVVPTTVDPTNLPAGIYAIDVVGGVINNFEEIVNNGPITVDGRTYPTINDYITHLTQTTGGFTKIVYDQTTGDVIFQEWDASTNSWVNVDNSKFETIVQANESQTTIITVNDKQYYVSEAYLAANDGVVPTTVDPTNLPAGIYAIDVVGGVVNNFEEIVNNGPITVDGRTYPTINDYITHLTQTTGGFTKIVYDQTTGDVIFQEWDASTNSWVNVDNSKFETIVQANESQTTIITVNDKQYYVSEAYLVANGGVVPTTVDAANLPAGIYAIDVVGGVVNNFEEIVKNGPITVDGRTYPTINDYITHLTQTTGGFTKIVYDQTTGDVIFQEWDASTNSWVNVDNSKFETIVQANESQTTIITVNDKQYYVSEAYLVANGGVVPTTVDATNLPAGIYAIDVVGGVVNNFEEIVKNGPITVDGRTYPTINDYITHLTETTGGFTKIVYDQTTGDVIFQEWDASTNSWVNVDNSKFKTIVTENETVTVLVKNANGTFTYYNEKEIDENGQPKAGATGVTIDPALVIVEDLSKSNGTYVFKDSEGNPIATIDINSDNILYDNTDSGLTSTNVKDALDELANTIATTKGDLAVAGGLEFTGTTDGTAKLLADAGIQIADGGVTTDKIGDKAVTSDKLDGGTGAEGRVGVAGADGTITYKTLDEVVKANETVTVLVENTNGTFTYYNENEIDENGQPKAGATGVTIDPKEVSVALNTTTNVYEFKNANGDVIGEIDANANAITYNDNSTQLGVTNVQGAIEKLLEKITTVEGTKGDLAVAGGLEFTGTTDGTAKLLADAGIQIADGGVTTDKIGDKAVTSDKLDGGQGVEGRVGVAGADGTITYKTLDEVVKANETVTVLVKNANGTFTYYNEKEIDENGQPKAGATGVTIDPALVIVEDLSKSNGTYVFKDSEGNTIATIDINSDNIRYDNTDSGLTSTNVKDALDELANTIATTKGDLSVAGGLEFTGTTDGTAKLLADAGIQIAEGGVTTDKIGDKAVTSDKLDGGTGAEGRVGVAGADGTITYKTLDEVVKANETVTVLVENTNGTFTYYNENEIDENGQPKAGAVGVTIDPKEVSVALNTATNVYEFKNSNGDVIGEIDANANAITYNDNSTQLGVTNVQGAIEKLLEKITTIEGTTGDLTLSGGLEFIERTTGAAKLLADANIQIADKGVTAGKLDGGKGLDGRVGVADGEGNITYKTLDEVVKANETVTLFVQNANGTYTYYNEDQIGVDGLPKAGVTGTTIDPKEVSVALNTTTNVYEFKNSNGDVIGEIDANANAISYDDSTTNLNVTNVQGAIEKLLEKITTVEGTKGSLTSASIYVDGGADALLKDAKLDLKGGSTDGQVLVTVTKDVVIGKDANGADITESRKVTEWQDPKDVVATTVTAKNGITVVNDADGNSEFRLGGSLDAATTITTSATNTLAIAGLDTVTTNPTANNLVVADAAGVLKQTSAKNMIEDVITQGDLEAKKLKGVGITVTAGENAGNNLNTEVASSLLKDVTLGIADKAVTAGKLDAGTSTSEAPRVGIADQEGNVTYQDLQTVVQAEQKTVVLENGTNTTVSSRVNATNPNETIWKVDVANAVKTVAAATALVAEDAVVLVDANAAPTEGIVITLPEADANNKGKKYTIKKLDTNEDGYVVVAGNVAGLNGKKLETGLPYSGWDFVSDGTQWQIVNKF
ncbi:putative NAD-dependent protein-ADP-ribosyltransferase YbiA (DUF1768 family) [Myroides gitamensis]|uniref:beta strand repeat-containing protein n=1 Tax=Myroides odoratus TaxID=256 RepID=UPI002169E712|nr:hypothetical protein [Myroides odoratus]MCS4239033.1 putative NAD-dependent protein-ADP-ribosyltransferase YbiA (DUF1768 family) [Myroides odoratus]MDH6599708.1 putative NAD-dependent protein-ADP-ribosyltransferase YbiA (DUF1768 family) [Myroides gitamensis]